MKKFYKTFDKVNSYSFQAYVRLLTSADEAFCFKNLILSSYNHNNLTLYIDSKISLTSVTATVLKRGNYTLDVELWLDGSVRDVKRIPLKVRNYISNK